VSEREGANYLVPSHFLCPFVHGDSGAEPISLTSSAAGYQSCQMSARSGCLSLMGAPRGKTPRPWGAIQVLLRRCQRLLTGQHKIRNGTLNHFCYYSSRRKGSWSTEKKRKGKMGEQERNQSSIGGANSQEPTLYLYNTKSRCHLKYPSQVTD
jgi:hypothetical protein